MFILGGTEMEYLIEPGAIYDSLEYTMFYFCRDYAIDFLGEVSENEGAINWFNEVYEKYKIKPPDCLYPLFWTNGKRRFMMSLLWDNITISYTDLRKKIQDRIFFKEFMYSYYVEPFCRQDEIVKIKKII